MGKNLKIKCCCGKVEGTARDISASSTNHVICSCRSCQLYAHFLGRTDTMLDAEGGSHIFQMNPNKFEINQGIDEVVAVRVTPNGPFRWHTRCCKTPLGNSFPRAGVPFLGVLPLCVGQDGGSSEFREIAGPVRAYVNKIGPSSLGEKVQVAAMLVRFSCMLLWWRIVGGRSAKPFFDASTGEPISEPFIMNRDVYEKLKADANL